MYGFKGKKKTVYLLMYVQAWREFIKHKSSLENSVGITFKSCAPNLYIQHSDILHQLRHSTFPTQIFRLLYIPGTFRNATDYFSFIGEDIVLSGNRRDAISVESIDVTHSSGAEIANFFSVFFFLLRVAIQMTKAPSIIMIQWLLNG